MTNFSRTDMLAARIGARDAQGCQCSEPRVPKEQLGHMARFIVWLFGARSPNALANPRLEAVRRFMCAISAGHRPSIAMMGELHRHGVQPAHLAALANLMN